MEILINLLKSSALLGLFFIIYYVFLRTDTFYQFKRFYFYSGLILSAVLPWIYFTKTVIIEKTSSAPIFVSQGNLPQAVTETTSLPIEASIDWYQVIFYVYLGIAVLVLLWYMVRYLKIFLELNKSQFEDKTTYKLHITSNEIGPFSFFKHIVVNRKDYESDNYNFILAHEATHTKEWHSLDVLITNIACALFWFNPVMWMYRKHWLQNLEHIADQAATKNTDKKAYQYLLLNSVLGQSNVQIITTTFFQPSIKQRIMMLNKSETPKIFSLKSLLVLPILILFVMNFQIKVNAQEKKPLRNGVETSLNSDLDSIKNNNALTNQGILIFAITKNADQDYLNRTKSALKTSYGIDVNYSDIIYNESGVLTSILVEVDCNDGFKGEAGNSLTNGINTIYVYRDYAESNSSPFGVGHISESEIEKMLSVENENIKTMMISPSSIQKSKSNSYEIKMSYQDNEESEAQNNKKKKDINDKTNTAIKAETVTESEVLKNLDKYIINQITYNLTELKRRILIVDSYELLDDKTIKIKGKFKDDLFKQELKIGEEIEFNDVEVIIFGAKYPIFFRMIDAKIVKHIDVSKIDFDFSKLVPEFTKTKVDLSKIEDFIIHKQAYGTNALKNHKILIFDYEFKTKNSLDIKGELISNDNFLKKLMSYGIIDTNGKLLKVIEYIAFDNEQKLAIFKLEGLVVSNDK